MNTNEYICAGCGGLFEKADDEEARKECAELWKTSPEETDCVIICDDCFNKFMVNYGAQTNSNQS